MEDIIRSCFREQKARSRNLWKHVEHIKNQFRFIDDDNCPKNAFLYDLGTVDVDIMRQIIAKLQERKLISANIRLARLADDVFILNIAKVLKSEHFGHSIDVSGSLKEPMVIDQGDKRGMLIANMIKSVKDQLRERVNDGSVIDIVIPDDGSEWCVPTLFGFLINYPTLYFLQTNDNDTNCLGCRDLKVFQVLINGDALLSFSIPLEIHNANEAIQRTISTYLASFQNHTVTSFISNYAHINL
jgi:hypothetical protein